MLPLSSAPPPPDRRRSDKTAALLGVATVIFLLAAPAFLCGFGAWVALILNQRQPAPAPVAPVAQASPRPRAHHVCAPGSPPLPRASQMITGSARTLEGKVCSLPVFVSESGQKWAREDKEKILAEIDMGHAWIREQARSYGASPEIERIRVDEDVVLKDIPSFRRGELNSYPAAEMLAEMGYEDGFALNRRMKADHACDQVHIISLVKKTGVSHALPFVAGDEKRQWMESVVVYDEKVSSLSVIMVHEMLHLYGAWDLYEQAGSGQTAANARRARQLWPNDVMLIYATRLEQVDVGPLTAWTVGWTTCGDPSYPGFEPWTSPGAN